ncbi:thermosome subunit [Methanocalculus chunghsingensis]|uniref:Thermosome subunit n=1 Tax=Methanocalculus chunghsingensis TaxID=156457 RepID=A0A8J7WBE5_9EURY|nr:thermosome subunit alpha [Methanocalculus chunghsingensis]MBR1369607.1 thermosome subunit [Methanocalculus chunghsingensis]
MQQYGGGPEMNAGIYREGTEKTGGRDALSNNIAAGKAVAAVVRTTLGPQGMDKMLVDSIGDVVITNDGVTILQEMAIEHPAAKMMVGIAKTQDDEAGDGTTTAVVLAGELLKTAETLLDQDVHPTVIVQGYRMAQEKAGKILEELSFAVGPEEREILTRIAGTAMTGKGAETTKEHLADLIVEAVSQITDEEGHADVTNIRVEKKVGGSADDAEIIEGIVIDKERLHPSMPGSVTDAEILLLNAAIEMRKTEVDAEITITRPEELEGYLAKEEEMQREMVGRIIASGADVVFCQKGIDEFAEKLLAKAGIFAVRRMKKSDMETIAEATGAPIISSLDAISGEELGYAGKVEEKRLSGERMVVISGCRNPHAVTLVVRGGTSHVVDELGLAVEDGLRGVGAALEDGKAVAGGGAVEMELSRRLSAYGSGVGGREQLAIEAFASALEVIPRTLAENAGLDPIDMLASLRTAHEQGMTTAGLNPETQEAVDMRAAGVIEPLRIKSQAISSAAEAAAMILRIDEIIASSGAGAMPSEEEMAAMQAMGGMGGGMPMM